MLDSEIVFEQFSKNLETFPKTTQYIVGFSGGLDSSVLLHLTKRWCEKQNISLLALHIHHGLHSQADQWEKHCEFIAKEWDISFIVDRVEVVDIHFLGLEGAARKARYAACSNYVNSNNILLFGHHLQDQAETFMLQLLRGSGMRGLSAMPLIRAFAKGFLARPLLNISRELIERYAKQNHITWIEDHSNENIDLARNYLRKKIFPLLTLKWPNALNQMSKSAEHCASTQTALDEYFLKYYLNDLNHFHILPFKKINTLPLQMQVECLRAWIYFNVFRMPPEKSLQEFLMQIFSAPADKYPYLTWDDCELRRFKDKIYLMKKFPFFKAQQTNIPWSLSEIKELKLGTCFAKKMQSSNESSVLLHHSITRIHIRFRKGKEVLALKKEFHYQLKNIWQQFNVPTWWRDHWPLVYLNEELIGVLGIAIAEQYQAKPGEEGWLINFKPREISHEFRSE